MSWIFYSFLNTSISNLPNLSISDPLNTTTVNANINQYIQSNNKTTNLFTRNFKPYYSSWVGQIGDIPQKYSSDDVSGNISWLVDIIDNLGVNGLTYYNTSKYTYTPSSSTSTSLSTTKLIASSLIGSLYNYNTTSQNMKIVFSKSSLFSNTN